MFDNGSLLRRRYRFKEGSDKWKKSVLKERGSTPASTATAAATSPSAKSTSRSPRRKATATTTVVKVKRTAVSTDSEALPGSEQLLDIGVTDEQRRLQKIVMDLCDVPKEAETVPASMETGCSGLAWEKGYTHMREAEPLKRPPTTDQSLSYGQNVFQPHMNTAGFAPYHYRTTNYGSDKLTLMGCTDQGLGGDGMASGYTGTSSPVPILVAPLNSNGMTATPTAIPSAAMSLPNVVGGCGSSQLYHGFQNEYFSSSHFTNQGYM